MPLFVIKDDQLHHIGTAFLISAHGVFATAGHCIMEAMRVHGISTDHFEPGGEYDLLHTDVKLSVLHAKTENGRVQLMLLPVMNMQVALPGDVAFGFLNGAFSKELLDAPRLSFGIPSAGSIVRAIGFSKNELPPIPMDLALAGEFDWPAYQPLLTVAIGRVRGTVLQGYGLVKGPCLLTDCPTENGMSGGPVINEAGDVCGVVSASASLEEGQGSLVSLLFPTLPVGLQVVVKPHPVFTLNLGIPLLMAVQRGLIRSDGTEKLHDIVIDGDQVRVDPLVAKEHLGGVFERAQDLWDQRPATPRSRDAGHDGRTT
jgi:hypothetical protein